MSNKPLVSVIVPIYKVEKYLRQCVESVVTQLYHNLEIILVDDGSPDNCGMICDEYAAKDSRIRVIHQKNAGVSCARNAGLDGANGDYIFFLDSDDWINRFAIGKMLDAYRETGADLVICNLKPVYEQGFVGERRKDSPLRSGVMSQRELIERIEELDGWYYCVAWNKLYPRELLKGIRFPEDFIHEDEAIAHRIFERCQSISVIAEPLYFYRQRNNSIMASGTNVKSTDALTALADRLCCARQNHWKDYEIRLASFYEGKLWTWYHQFCGNGENVKYKERMEQSLKKALPSVLRCTEVPFSHKIYLILLRYNPNLFWIAYRSIRRIKNQRKSI